VNHLTDAPPDPRTPPDARQEVAALYQRHALGLVKLAKVMLGDQAQAEDIVHDAFLGLHRKWASLRDRDHALAYLRASVVNGCRGAHRSRSSFDRALRFFRNGDDIVSAEESAIVGEANREVIAAVRALPARQREAVVLRHYLGLSEAETAAAMGVAAGTVKSSTSRGLAALSRQLKETQ
jgi:RNA polymerase sigma-70 factor (sigma-E family)